MHALILRFHCSHCVSAELFSLNNVDFLDRFTASKTLELISNLGIGPDHPRVAMIPEP
jgi:hypothetical protein